MGLRGRGKGEDKFHPRAVAFLGLPRGCGLVPL